MPISLHSLAVLEFTKVLPELEARADSAWGRELAAAVSPAPDLEAARGAAAEVAEWRLLEAGEPAPPSLALPDIRPALAGAAVPGAVLEPAELLDVARVAAASRLARDVLEERAEAAPRLVARGPELGRFHALEQAIGRAIDERGQVRDDASPTLARLRRRIESTRAALLQRLERIAARLGPESFVTLRGGRHTVAVPTSEFGRAKGIVHDRSASGATVFVEPFEAVELGNRLREDEEDERAEVRRILGELTAKVGAEGAPLLLAAEALAGLDLLRSKARLFQDWSCVLPELRAGGPIALRGGRHPLLARARAARGESVVPLSLELGGAGGARILVITGPNMGGKTVALKTLGLLTLMAMAGLGVPAEEGTALGFFPTVVADIGDEQSIEENLSTFASHVRHLREALEMAGPGTLVLLDELGAGTDPAEGAALGQAILETLAASEAVAMVTTHHGALKGMAMTHPVIVNGAMAFDPESQAPLYALTMGVPGRSLGLAVAERLGFPRPVLERAGALVPESERELEGLLVDVERRRLDLVRAREEIEGRRRELGALLSKYRGRLAEVREMRAQVLAEGKRRVEAVVGEAEELVRAARRALRRAGERAAVRAPAPAPAPATGPAAPAGQEPGVEALAAALRAAGDKASAMAAEAAPPAPGGGAAPRPAEVAAGETYWLPDLGALVEVVEPPDGAGRVVVRRGGFRLELGVERLRVAPPEAKAAERVPPARVQGQVEVEMPPSLELDLRGLRGDEAVAEVERYLEQAAVHGLKQVRIIHGKGTGALRARIQDILKSHPRVETFRLGEMGEGGAGVTVAVIA